MSLVFPTSLLVLALAAPLGGVPDASLVRLQSTIASAIAAVRPAVVDIRSQRHPAGGWPYESAGAGIIVDPRGLVLTNEHVVGGAQEIEVRVWQGGAAPYVARLLASDPERDLALLALGGSGPFPSVVFGDPELLREGERVVAIGTPLGLPHSASSGIVSHPRRTLHIGERTYPDMIQTDATVNQGNSGGPMLNLHGEVIGLVTAIFAPEGVSTGVAFAIPADHIRQYLGSMGRVTGLRTAAFERDPIRIGQTRSHPFSGNCTECHVIRAKLAISMASEMPHPYVGDCETCHTFSDALAAGATPPTAGRATAVAWSVPAAGAVLPFEAGSGPAPRTPVLVAGAGLLALGACGWLWRNRRRVDR